MRPRCRIKQSEKVGKVVADRRRIELREVLADLARHYLRALGAQALLQDAEEVGRRHQHQLLAVALLAPALQALRDAFGIDDMDTCYGRTALIYTDGVPAVELLEIVADV